MQKYTNVYFWLLCLEINSTCLHAKYTIRTSYPKNQFIVMSVPRFAVQVVVIFVTKHLKCIYHFKSVQKSCFFNVNTF